MISYCRMFRSACVGLGVVSLVLSGCASTPKIDPAAVTPAAEQVAAQKSAEAQAAEFHQILAELRRASECVSATEARPEYAPLRAKAPNDTQSGPYPSQMLDKSKASAKDATLINALIAQITPCQPSFPPLAVRVHQSITRMISETWMQQHDLYRHLKDGQISWGVFNQGTRSNADKLSGGLQALRLSNDG